MMAEPGIEAQTGVLLLMRGPRRSHKRIVTHFTLIFYKKMIALPYPI